MKCFSGLTDLSRSRLRFLVVCFFVHLVSQQSPNPRLDVTFGNQQCVAGVDGELVFDREETFVLDQDRAIPPICQRAEQTAYHAQVSARTSLSITHRFDPKILYPKL